MIELLPTNLKIDFLGKRRYAYAVSFAFVCLTFYTWFNQGDRKYGIDFLGGYEIIASISEDVNSQTIKKALETEGFEDPVVQSFESASHQYSIRLASGSGSELTGEQLKNLSQKVETTLKKSYPSFSIAKTDFVGPAVGEELKTKALWAIILGLIGITIYIAIRFEFAFAFGAVLAILHDVLICTGFYLLAGHQVTMGMVAAALTIVGYSVNDTVVIFDRVREEYHRHPEDKLEVIMNRCVNSMLSRTIITSMLTLFSALALLIFGGGTIADLSMFLVVGIITGTFSTVFVASPLVLWWVDFRDARAKRRAQQKPIGARA